MPKIPMNQPSFPTDEREISRAEGEKLSKITTAPPMVPMPGEEGSPEFNIDELMLAHKRQSDAEAERIQKLRNDEYVYFVRCRHHEASRESAHGIYLTKLPGPNEPVRMNEWYSRYKPTPGEMYLGPIVCQICLRRGIETNYLDVNQSGVRGEFTVSERWLWRRPKDPKRLAVEGETRARDLPAGSANIGREEATQRSVSAGLEPIR